MSTCFGYDLDSDGGRLVTSADLLHSDLLEVVQVYGMDYNSTRINHPIQQPTEHPMHTNYSPFHMS